MKNRKKIAVSIAFAGLLALGIAGDTFGQESQPSVTSPDLSTASPTANSAKDEFRTEWNKFSADMQSLGTGFGG